MKDAISISEDRIHGMKCISMANDLLRSGGDLFTYLKLLSACVAASAKARSDPLIQHSILLKSIKIEQEWSRTWA